MYVILHQAGFLLTGLCTTLGVQWLFYRGAATSMSLLPQLSNYIGMLLVSLYHVTQEKNELQTYSARRRGRYNNSPVLSSSCSIRSEQTMIDNLPTIEPLEEGPIEHLAIIKLASLDILPALP
ncbi:uncharacterized protein EV154DRAFT_572909 [Mucor mucedo]|uniref:uncharacterized protein n=1 Tax=Mucor mucedo TaxID=29922 RepID=UPI00221EA5C3|nr:uncharacterized protein EV154DRAFT_572909 [Mucor mucedo]KAI7862780.1 hypothetical protein EV154DRAFT_572909 [Mucor mucedo]